MQTFNVSWEIEIDAETPLEAARQARNIQLDPENQSGYFTVVDENGEITDVDVLNDRDIRCSDCKRPEGEQHRPSCHRQGMITEASDYRQNK